MSIKEIMLTNHLPHSGYMPQNINITSFAPDGILKKLSQIPRKITAYFDKNLIKAVYKTTFNNLDQDYYIICAVDGTLFHVEY